MCIRDRFYSLPALSENGYPRLNRLPVSIRIVLESLLRNCDGLKVTEKDVEDVYKRQIKWYSQEILSESPTGISVSGFVLRNKILPCFLPTVVMPSSMIIWILQIGRAHV